MRKRANLLVSAFHAAVAAAAVPRKPTKGDKELKAVPGNNNGRVQRNAACVCGSGKKMKKCCGSARIHLESSVVEKAEEFIAVAKGLPQTVVAMLRAETPAAEVYAYYHTGEYITDENRGAKSAEMLALWDAHVEEFTKCDVSLQQKILADISAASSNKGG